MIGSNDHQACKRISETLTARPRVSSPRPSRLGGELRGCFKPKKSVPQWRSRIVVMGIRSTNWSSCSINCQPRLPPGLSSWQAVAVTCQRSERTADPQRSGLTGINRQRCINRQRLRRVNAPQTPPSEKIICRGVIPPPSTQGGSVGHQIHPRKPKVTEQPKQPILSLTSLSSKISLWLDGGCLVTILSEVSCCKCRI